MGAAVRSGARLGLIAGGVEQALSTVATLALARLLLPEEFGLVAATQSLVGLLAILGQVGFASTLVRRDAVDQRTASTVWWSSATLGATLTIVTIATAAPLAVAVGLPTAAPLVRILGLTLLLRLLASTPRALLLRNLRYRRIYAVDATAIVVYVAVELVLAWAGAGAVAVVVGQVAAAMTALVGLLASAFWLPSVAFDAQQCRRDLRFNVTVLGTHAASFLSKNVDFWFVGHTLGGRALGLYYVAYVLPNIIRLRLTTTATDVLAPVFVRCRNNPERTRAIYLQSLSLHALAGGTTMVGVASCSREILAVFFGSAWVGASDALAVLALAAAVEFVNQAVTTVHLAHRRPSENVIIQIGRLVVMSTGLVIAAHAGDLVHMSMAVLAGTLAASVIAQGRLARYLDLRVRAVCRQLAVCATPAAMMWVTLGLLRWVLNGTVSVLATLVIFVVTGIVVFLAAGVAIWRSEFTTVLRAATSPFVVRRRRVMVPGSGA